ncbi:ATP-binding protein [Paraburkholderia sp. EG287B]|uniref:ATP-binding protein n=1 Tax=Paraburkholderia sp. EG287B TaxID=3237010 RepID=UPI0034D1B354
MELWTARVGRTALTVIAGGAVLVLSAWICFLLGSRLTVAATVCVTELALLALVGSLTSSILLSVIAVGSLDYLFTEPLFTFRLDLARDVWALTAFFVTSLTVNGLVHRLRRLAAIHREQAMLLDLTHDSVTVRDMDDSITYWNRGAEALFGWKGDEALGNVSRSLLRSRYPVDPDEIKQTLLETGYWEGEVMHLAKSGAVVTAQTRQSVLRNKQGLPTAILETSTDITERKRNEEALGYLARVTTIGEFGASLAHEVGQPLASIGADSAAALSWLNRESPNIEKALTSLRRIDAECRRATEIIRRVRGLTKREPPNMTRLDINDVVREVVPIMQRELLNHQATLKTKLDPHLPPALGDRIQLAQVTINLVMNAVTDRPRELVIESRRGDAGDVIVAVRDSGTGIEPGNAERLFQPFFTTKPEGMGVGLSICQAIIVSHGGEIRLRNNVGHGATVEFSVPALAAPDVANQQ